MVMMDNRVYKLWVSRMKMVKKRISRSQLIMGKEMVVMGVSVAQRGGLLVYLSNKQLESRRRALYTTSEGPLQISSPLWASSSPSISTAPFSPFFPELQSKWASFASHPKSEVHGQCQTHGVSAFLRDDDQPSLPVGQAVGVLQGEGVFVYRCILARLRGEGGTAWRRIICCGMVAVESSRLWLGGGWECLRGRLLPVMARCRIQRINAQRHHFRPSLKLQSQLAWRLQTNQRKGAKSEGDIWRWVKIAQGGGLKVGVRKERKGGACGLGGGGRAGGQSGGSLWKSTNKELMRGRGIQLFDILIEMRAAILDQDENELILTDNGEAAFQKPQNQHQKPFMASMIHKTVPIGYEYHQVAVPDAPAPFPASRQALPPPRSPSLFLRSRVQEEELEEYLSFVESYYQQKVPDYFAQGIVSRDRARSQAMELLHSNGYNYTQAKFFLIFPYYLTYNRFRPHAPLALTESEMARRISCHLEGLRSTKEKELERWIGTVENSIESRIHLSKLNTLIEVAKQNKFEIPEAIREHVERSIKTGRQIKKTLHSTRLPLDKLLARKEQLQECKIITNEMIQFQETVTRCEEWLKKQRRFEEACFSPESTLLLHLPQKIEFRTLQLLVNEFNNLPLVYDNFERTTGSLYAATLALLERLPPLNKAAKTRTAQSSSGTAKVSIESVREFLREIAECPVEHEDFVSFETSIREQLEWVERIGLWLEDERAEKSLKVLNQYAKIINDVPIANRVQAKLQSRLEYYQIMERVKKDISNPAKYQQIKDAIKKLKEKGYQTCEYARLESRIVSYMGWYESQQILNEDRLPPAPIDLLTRRKNIQQRMIPQEAFRLQLLSARQELNIPQEVWAQSEGKVVAVEALRGRIRSVLSQESPALEEVLELVRQGIKNGLLFEEFQLLYTRLIDIYFVLAKMEFMLMASQEAPPQGQAFFFGSEDLEYVFGTMNELMAFEVRTLQSKEAGDEVLREARNKAFPKQLVAYRMFEQFMLRAETWSVRAQELILAFKQESASETNIRQLIEQSRNCLHSQAVEEELNRIDIILKWREKIGRKLSEGRESPFDQDDHSFMLRLEADLRDAESSSQGSQKMKMRALQWLAKEGRRLHALLQKIGAVQIECTYKLSEMNKFCKEVDREVEKYRLEDRQILALKEELQRQLLLSDDWKEKYLAIKRFERRKLRKDEDDDEERKIDGEEERAKAQVQQGEGVQLAAYVPALNGAIVEGKRKYYIRNGQFCWFYKLPLMVFQFYNGFGLRFAIEELVRLRTTLGDIHRFISHYNTVITKPDKNDQELLSLQAQGAKFPLFFRETYVLAKKNAYISAWKELAASVLKSVPVLSMELKARKPEQLLELLESRKQQKEEGREQGRQQLGSKRKRKQNPFYSNEDMTLITEETFGLKTKKKRKGLNMDTEYRNTAVASSAKKQARSQREEYERAQALLSGEVPAQLIHIDDPKEYCICRFGVPNENSIMVQCQDRCEEWFHIECLGIKKHQTKNDIKLICVGCRSLYRHEPLGYFFWDSHSKITEYALEELVAEGRALGVETAEMKKLEVLYTKMIEWKSAVKDMLRKVCETNGEDLPALEPPLYELFLQSLWLPSAHPQAAILRKLVLMARNEL